MRTKKINQVPSFTLFVLMIGLLIGCKKENESISQLPTVTTATITNQSQTSALSGGNVTSDGGASITMRGVCWSVSQNPSISDTHTSDGVGTGNFTSSLTGLNPNTAYYVRAYATNEVGTSYGQQLNTLDPTNYFKSEYYSLDDNLVPSNWNLIVTNPEVLLADGRLTAKIIDAYGALARAGTIPPGTNKLNFEWDGSLQSTYWGQATSLQVDYATNQNLQIYAQLAEVGNSVSNRIFLLQYSGTTRTVVFEKEIAPIYDNYHFKVILSSNSITFSANNISSGSAYFSESVNLPSNLNFSLEKVSVIKYWVNATTDNDCWLDNLSIGIIQ